MLPALCLKQYLGRVLLPIGLRTDAETTLNPSFRPERSVDPESVTVYPDAGSYPK